MKSQPESAAHTPFTKRQPYQAATSTSSMLDVFLQDKGLPPSSSSSSLPQQTTSSPHGVPPPASSLPKMTAVPSLGQQVSPSSSDAQSPLPLQQHKLKQQKKRTSITTKVIHLWIHLDRQKWRFLPWHSHPCTLLNSWLGIVIVYMTFDFVYEWNGFYMSIFRHKRTLKIQWFKKVGLKQRMIFV